MRSNYARQMSRTLRYHPILLFAVISLFGMTGCDRKGSAERAKFQAHLDEFIREGSVLNSYTEQGVNYQAFGDQLAKTRAAFNLTYPDVPSHDLIQYQHFANAVRGWSAAYKLWRRKISDTPYLNYFGSDLELLNSVLTEINEQVIPEDSTTDKKADVSKVISLAMTYSAEQFQKGHSMPFPK